MLKPPDDRTKAAFSRLRGDADFHELLVYLGDNLAAIDARSRVTMDAAMLRMQQGAGQAIAEFIDHAHGKEKAIAVVAGNTVHRDG